MKKHLISMFLVLSTITSFAQISIKTDALGLVYSNYSVAIEYTFTDNLSVGFYQNMKMNNPFVEARCNLQYTVYTYTSLRLTPEFRYYFNPKTRGDGVFFGGYLIYKTEQFTNLHYTDPISGNKTNYSVNYHGHGLGLVSGYKVPTKSRFLFEVLLGVGRITPYNIYGAWSHVNEVDFYNQNLVFPWDFRFELTVGLKLGKLKAQ